MSTDDAAHLVVLNEALFNLGGAIDAATLATFDDAEQHLPNARRRYDTTINGLYAAHPWSWLVTPVELVRLAEAPASGFAYAYSQPLPGTLQAVYRQASEPRRPFHGYRLLDGKIHSSEAQLWAEIRTGGHPDAWPDYFRTLAIAALEATFCFTLTSDRIMERERRAVAFGLEGVDFPNGGLMGAAKGLDSKQEAGGQLMFGADPLTSARYC